MRDDARPLFHAGQRKVRTQSRSEEFRAHAAECRELANRIRDPEVKRQYEELARQWLELAEYAERRSD